MKYTIIAISILLASCSTDTEKMHAEKKSYVTEMSGEEIEITEYTIDGCQYLGHLREASPYGNYLTHKGNCNNTIHNQQK